MTKAIQRNITLEAVYDNYKRRFNRATKEKVRNIIGLYSERKIAQFTTADNLIRIYHSQDIKGQRKGRKRIQQDL